MSIPEIIGFITLSTFMLGLIGFVLGNQRVESRARKRVYERMDEVKDEIGETYTRKDVCAERHKTIEADLSEIKRDVKTLLTKNGL